MPDIAEPLHSSYDIDIDIDLMEIGGYSRGVDEQQE